MKQKLLTEAELELMTALWKMSEGSVNDLIEQLPKGRAYTTVSTIVRILEQKGFLSARKEGRGHIYKPEVTRQSYESRTVRDVVERVFEGAPVALARQLLQTENLSGQDLAELRRLIEELEARK
jgi:predicted transcriptional regulator